MTCNGYLRIDSMAGQKSKAANLSPCSCAPLSASVETKLFPVWVSFLHGTHGCGGFEGEQPENHKPPILRVPPSSRQPHAALAPSEPGRKPEPALDASLLHATWEVPEKNHSELPESKTAKDRPTVFGGERRVSLKT